MVSVFIILYYRVLKRKSDNMKKFNLKKILGRWFENLGVGIVSGTVILASLNLLSFYFISVGAILVAAGTILQETA